MEKDESQSSKRSLESLLREGLAEFSGNDTGRCDGVAMSALLAHISDLGRRSAECVAMEELNRLQQTRIKKLSESEIGLKKEVESLTDQLAKLSDRVNGERRLAEQYKESSEAGERKLAALTREMEAQSAQMRSFEARFQDEISELEASLSDQKSENQASLRRVKDEHNRKLAQLADANWEKELVISELRKNESELKRQLAESEAEVEAQTADQRAVAAELSRVNAELAARAAELSFLKNHLDPDSSNREIERYKREAKELRFECGRLEKEWRKAQGSISSLSGELENARTALEQAVRATRDEFSQVINAKDLRIRTLEAECAGLGRELQRAIAAEAKMRGQFEDVQASMHSAQSALQKEIVKKQTEFIENLSTKEMQIQELTVARQSLERDLQRAVEGENRFRERLEREEAKLRSREDEWRTDLSKAKNESMAAEAQLAVSREQVTALREEVRRVSGELEMAGRSLAALRESEARQFHEVGELRSRLDAVVSESRALEADLQKSEERFEVAEREMRQRDLMIKELKKEMAALGDALRLERSKVAASASQSELRENQLRVYSGILNREKSEVQRIGRQLVKEIRMLAVTHPLKDYLAATEFELSKVEIQLKKTPVMAMERARVEEYLAGLVEQRDFLKTVLNGSQKQFETQAAELERMLASGAMSQLPPPAPSAGSLKKVPSPATAASSDGPRWEKPFDHIA